MLNLKHTASALAAVAMVGSLAANQAADITSVRAQKSSVEIQFKQPDILKGDGEGTVLDLLSIGLMDNGELGINMTGYVNTSESYINLYSEPSAESEAIAQLVCADSVFVLEYAGDYFKVEYGEKEGYVLKEYLTRSYQEARDTDLKYFKYESGLCNADGVNIRDGAGTEGTDVIDQVDKDALIFVLERVDNDWMKVYYGKNYDTGYVMASFVTIDDAVRRDEVANARKDRVNAIAKKGVVSSNGAKVNVRRYPSENAEIIDTLSDGNEIRIVLKGSKWTKIAIGDNGDTAFVNSSLVLDEAQIEAKNKQKAQEKAREEAREQAQKSTVSSAPAKTAKSAGGSGQAIVAEAEKYLGTNYVYGGNSPSKGFDCSGLVQYVCRQVGISVNRSSRSQYSNGVAVSRDNLQPGDLVFFSKGSGISHVVIYAGNGKVIHSPRPGKKVCYTTLSNICSYSNYVGARRVV